MYMKWFLKWKIGGALRELACVEYNFCGSQLLSEMDGVVSADGTAHLCGCVRLSP